MSKRRASLRVVVVDDSEQDRARYQRRLSMIGLTVIPVLPKEHLAIESILAAKPDVILVDYQLNEAQPDGTHPSYLGSTLAAVLRAERPENPILLVSKRSLLETGTLSPARDLESAFDHLYYKEDIFSDPRAFRGELDILDRGYHELRSKKERNWKALVALLRARTDEAELLESADPPAGARTDTWRVPEIARWLRGTVLAYPGLLYDPLHAAVTLGLARQSFLSPSIQRLFSSCRYRGPFAPRDGRWWRGRILLVAVELLRRQARDDATLSRFGEVWNSNHRAKQKLSVCCVSKRSPADSVCFLLKRPVLRKFSLAYHPDNRPGVMDEARVSTKAIRERNDFEEHFVAKEARGLIKAIQAPPKRHKRSR